MKPTKLFKRLLLAAAMMALLPQWAAAYDFMVDGLCYDRNSDGTSVTVTYQRTSIPVYYNLSGDLVIPEAVTYDGTSYSVTAIGDYAFDGCSGLTSVTIPNSVTSIDLMAFERCSGLTSVTIPNSVTSIGDYAFYYCSGLTGKLTIPNSVTYMGQSPFGYCSGLTSVSIPNSVTSISFCAFTGCSGLTSLSIPNSVTAIGDGAFYGCSGLTSLTIPNSVKTIGIQAFYACSGLTSVTIPNSVKTIDYQAFYCCNGIKNLIYNAVNCSSMGSMPTSNIESVIIGDNVRVIPDYFVSSSKITSVTVPNSVSSIGNYAFQDCIDLTSVTIPNSVTSIGYQAFENTAWYNNQPDGLVYAGLNAYKYKGTMPNGTNIEIIEGTKSITQECFNQCSGLTEVTIPNSVTSIGEYAFQGCSGLTSVIWNAKSCGDFPYSTNYPFASTSIQSITFGDEVEYIPARICLNLTSLTKVTISNSVTSIGQSAFRDCSGLTSVTIGNSVTSIGTSAFYGCGSLTEVICFLYNAINHDVFNGLDLSGSTLYVPVGTKYDYANNNYWSKFGSIIEFFPVSQEQTQLDLLRRHTMRLITNGDFANSALTWNSADTTIAVVSDYGWVNAVSLGETLITAISPDNGSVVGSCLVKVVPNCDVNDDERVDISDVNGVINKMLARNQAPSLEAADINCDDEVDIFDINMIIGKMLGYSSSNY